MKYSLIALSLGAVLASHSVMADSHQDIAELKQLLQQQTQMLQQLQQRLVEAEQKLQNNVQQDQQLERTVVENSRKIEITAEEVEHKQPSGHSAFANTTIGGYGELHYNNIDDDEKIDFHRFVTFIGHEFNDKTRFVSEVELEHAESGEGKEGEVELEQAYIEHDINEGLSAKVGLFLLPVGIINETHEPPAFYGVERNPIEKDIIPTTWWEGGASFTFRPAGGWSIDGAVTSGLSVPTDGGNAFKIRNGRQKVSEANADSLAYTGRVKYTAIQGLELASTVQYQEDITQGEFTDSIEATLFSAHAIYHSGPFSVRALYARWDLDGDAPETTGRDEQEGFYIEPSYRISNDWGIFARYNEWDNNAGNNLIDSEKRQYNVGFNYWLDEHVVLKADWENRSGAIDGDGFNLGMGYHF